MPGTLYSMYKNTAADKTDAYLRLKLTFFPDLVHSLKIC